MPTALQDARRASQVIRVFFKHGLGDLVREFGIKKRMFRKELPKDSPVRLRKALEELGGAYLKFGQFLSLRPDYIPQNYCDELRKLLDNVTPVSFSAIKKIINAEIGEKAFKSIEKKPIGSASIAQVHKAVLKNGKKVVVKIIRPNVGQKFAEDIDILRYMAYIAEKYIKNSVSPTAVVREFENYTKRELNMIFEARVIDKFQKFFAKKKTFVVPKVYWTATTQRVLTMEYIQGIPLTQVLRNPKGAPLHKLAKQLSESLFEQIFELRYFHADPHPGNLLLTPKNKLALLDYGIVGIMDEQMSVYGIKFMQAVIERDTKKVVDVLMSVGTPSRSTRKEDFTRDVRNVLNEWYDGYGRVRFTHIMHMLFNTCIKNKIRMPRDLLLLGKAALTAEGTSLALDPSMDFEKFAEEKLKKITHERYKPQAIAKRAARQSREAMENVLMLPSEARDILEKLRRGDLKLDLTDLRHVGHDVELSSNRLSYAILVASLFVSSGLLKGAGPKIAGYSIVPVLLFLAGINFMIPLAISIYREDKGKYRHAIEE